MVPEYRLLVAAFEAGRIIVNDPLGSSAEAGFPTLRKRWAVGQFFSRLMIIFSMVHDFVGQFYRLFRMRTFDQLHFQRSTDGALLENPEIPSGESGSFDSCGEIFDPPSPR